MNCWVEAYTQNLKPTTFCNPINIDYRYTPTGKFALSGFRVFGKEKGTTPGPVKEFVVLRGKNTHRKL